MPNIDIPKLNQIFGLQVDICRYCKGECTLSMRECDKGKTYPYSECPSCKETIRGYRVPQSFGEATSPKAARGMYWIWREADGSV